MGAGGRVTAPAYNFKPNSPIKGGKWATLADGKQLSRRWRSIWDV